MDAVTPDMRAEADLLQRLQAGEQDAWVEFIRSMQPRLLGYLRNNVPTQEDAEDVLGETMVAAVRSLKDFDGKASLSTYIFSLAYRKIADFWRKRQDTVALVEQHRSPLRVNSKALEFIELLDQLPELSKQVLMLKYQVGLSVGEIAQVLDRSYKGTESLLSRARQQLRDIIDDTGFEYE
ncbi:MAG: sigma-70 family RNA polymerase sigma factor [Caldilineaceae bacterium]|nr:sigma-70 family RNA polymerase sigma factor [Caldilineaceae bacterium]